mmetsp:Transcript_30386/g.72298  ORF Transcript_30386/g.72298 Transcript_30386/m.72298 type:complete len:232 (+) Transcript_30386:103-798(+)
MQLHALGSRVVSNSNTIVPARNLRNSLVANRCSYFGPKICLARKSRGSELLVWRTSFSSSRCYAESQSQATAEDVPRVVVEGDVVRVHYVCRDENGEMIESSRDAEVDGLSFEVGSGGVTGNPFYQGFDEAVRGLSAGQTVTLEASGGEWKQDLVFNVPRDHEEIARLEGRYKNQGGLYEGAIVELSNRSKALVLKVTDGSVMLDANNMLAGKKIFFEIELVEIQGIPPHS